MVMDVSGPLGQKVSHAHRREITSMSVFVESYTIIVPYHGGLFVKCIMAPYGKLSKDVWRRLVLVPLAGVKVERLPTDDSFPENLVALVAVDSASLPSASELIMIFVSFLALGAVAVAVKYTTFFHSPCRRRCNNSEDPAAMF